MPSKYIDLAELEYRSRDLPACTYCGVEAGKICITVNDNLTNPHAIRTQRNKPPKVAQVFKDPEPHQPGIMCTGQMHNISTITYGITTAGCQKVTMATTSAIITIAIWIKVVSGKRANS